MRRRTSSLWVCLTSCESSSQGAPRWSIRFSKNRSPNHLGREASIANLDLDRGAGFGEGGLDVAKADAATKRWALGAAGHFADLAPEIVAGKNEILLAGRGTLAGHPEADALARDAVLFLRDAGLLADEADLVVGHSPAQPGLDRCRVGGQLVAVEGVTGLGAEGVARAQSGRNEAKRLAKRGEFFP